MRAALRIVDEEGLPALNMRRLGAAMGVEAMAAYKHFPGKAAILDAVVALVLRDLDESVPQGDWREGFRGTFLALRAILRVHPNALPLVASRPLASPQLANRLAATRDLLLRALPEREVLHLLHAGFSLTLGYLWLESGGFVGELPDSEPFLRVRAEEAGPPIDASAAAMSTWNRDEDYAAGLELLLVDPSRRRAGP